jgi:hypothetical protein
VSRPFSNLWMLEASARIQWLRANVLASSLLEAGPLLRAPVEAWLPELKLSAGREIVLAPNCLLQLGASVAIWRTLPEGDLFLPSSIELAWTERLDLRVGVAFKERMNEVVYLSVEAFDLFDSGRRRGSLEGRSIRFGLAVSF